MDTGTIRPIPQLPTPTDLINATLMPMLLLSLTQQRYTPNTARTIRTEYDYVIVGSGSAGSVVASRLTEIPCVSALVLEAGSSPSVLTDVPGFSRLFYFTDIDYQYRTTPQKYAGRGLVNRQVPWTIGRAVGGSSVLNAMLSVRGNRNNFDNWAKEGAVGWSYKDVLPYFIKMEDNRDPEFVTNGYHGVGGPQTVHRPRYTAEIKHPIFETAKALGYKVVDPNGPWQTSFYDVQGTLRSGQRCSTAKAYLVPAENRTNLDILPEAFVKKILFKDKRAYGVEFEFQNTTYVVKARKEVIISAGTIGTAKLLMLSGIGPKHELERLKIPVVADLPVGQNLHDHSASFLSFLLSPTIQPITAKLSNPANIAQYIQNRTGPLSTTEFVSALAFLKNWEVVPDKDFPDHELYFEEAVSELAFQIGVTPQLYSQWFAPVEGRAFYVCISAVLQPRSRGTITLQSRDPSEPPLIDPHYFEDPKDLEDIVEGLKTCNKFGTSPALQQVGSTPFNTLLPGCEQYHLEQDLYLRCVAKTLTITIHDPVGTARMGDPKDPRTVVDPHLRVKYIKGLRVVDASVMPIITSGNTNIPTIMIAEKASDIIKASIKCHKQHHSEDTEYDSQLKEHPGDDSGWKEDHSNYDGKKYPEDSGWQEKPGESGWKEDNVESGWKEDDGDSGWKEGNVESGWKEDDGDSGWKDSNVDSDWKEGNIDSGWLKDSAGSGVRVQKRVGADNTTRHHTN